MAPESAESRPEVVVDSKSLEYIIDHVFLPPQLPQKDDTSPKHSLATIQVMCDSVTRFLSAECASLPAVQPALETLERFLQTVPGQDHGETLRTQVLRDMVAHLRIGGAYIQTP